MYSDNEDGEDEITGLIVQEVSPPPEDYKYEVLNSDQIVENMVSSIREVRSVVQLNTTITRILLNHFRWDKERLYERIFDGNRELLFKEAKVPLVISEVSNETLNKNLFNSQTDITSEDIPIRTYVSSSQSEKPCQICFVDSDELSGLGCGHAFCKTCWIMYLSTKIMEDGQSGRITCAAHDCEYLMDDQTVLPLINDPKVRLRYQQLITNSYVECNKQMRWCPKPGCGHAIKVNYVEFQPVKCKCGSIFCFLCGDSWHSPVKCDLIKRWKKKCHDDSETSRWIAVHTKECPKCRITIEKDGGCNHMVCKNTDCRSEFCWVCLGSWEHHGSSWYSCNRFDESGAKAARDAQDKSRALLQRYLHYFQRYMNHLASLRLENKLYANVKDKMRDLQQYSMSWIDVQFLMRAVDVLCQCRQTLMYTYVFAYYLKKTNQSEIFEDNQRDLESATEKLSEFLERDITDDIKNIKQKVQDKYRYCESRRKILLEHVQEGYEQDWWDMADL